MMAAVTVDGTVAEEKVDLEIPQEKVDDVKKVDEAEPESAGGCDVSRPASRRWRGGYDFYTGGLLADGFNSFLATLFTSPPNTTFSQNNGVITFHGHAAHISYES